MGKRGKDKKKGKGAEKTAVKTDKKQSAKQKKQIAALGEDDIESIVAQIEREEAKREEVVETIVGPPSSRANFTFISHPDKEELILFGGEFFNGQKTFVYNDLFLYNVSRNEWRVLKAPSGPAPRCGHQMVALGSDGGQLWLFGGEYASPTQSQFYHYRDLWVFRIAQKKWEKINAAGGPSARSGHRMVISKKQLIVFGGFHDNLRDYKYYNDLHVFSFENYTWSKIDPTGIAPAPRSACCLASAPDGRVLLWGGYSKVTLKKEVEKGTIHTDMFVLAPDKRDPSGNTLKWTTVKAGGARPGPRSGVPIYVSQSKAYSFGGVMDKEETEEDLEGTFYDDLLCLDFEKLLWRTIDVTGKKDPQKIRKRRRKDAADIEDESDPESDEQKQAEEVKTTVSTDGVFTMVVSGSKSSTVSTAGCSSTSNRQERPSGWPSVRMNAGIAICKGVLYLYGGLVEIGTKQFTLADFYSIDLHKLDEWRTIIPSNLAESEWLGSGSESESEDDDIDEANEDVSDGSDSEDSSSDMDTA